MSNSMPTPDGIDRHPDLIALSATSIPAGVVLGALGALDDIAASYRSRRNGSLRYDLGARQVDICADGIAEAASLIREVLAESWGICPAGHASDTPGCCEHCFPDDPGDGAP